MPKPLPHFCNNCHKPIKIYVEDIFIVGPLGYEKLTGYLRPYPSCPLCGSQDIKIKILQQKAIISG